MNVQARIYPTGQVVICWGDGRLPPSQTARTAFVSQLGSGLFLPATGPAFDGFSGNTFPGVLPSNICREIVGA